MSAPTPPDPWLQLPLDGVRLIEASAGTGKTFTLATLVTRLVVEGGLRIGEILAVTFTEAATQELRKRIRERLQLTLVVMDTVEAEDDSHEVALTRQVVTAHLARGEESADALRIRLRTAVLDTDLAAIFTIHGFCMRVLREHALESGQGFDAPELLANDRDLRDEIAADLWRAHARDDATTVDLSVLWKGGHEALARDLPALLQEPVLLPPDAPLPEDPSPRLRESGAALANGFREHGAVFLDAVRFALAGKVLNGKSYTLDWIEPMWKAWAAWCEVGDFATPPDARIARFTTAAMLERTNKGKEAQVPQSSLCGLIEAYLEAVRAHDDYLARRRAALLHRIRDDARARMTARKYQLHVQTYDDLINGVADALAGELDTVLATQLRTQYRVALVDEFQDTDARQWTIFDRVFGSGSGSPAPALFLIGDPKQAIYSFRGGDVHAYLDAKQHAEEAPALSVNFRSRPLLLGAVEALYGQAGENAFVDAGIAFHPVTPGERRSDADFLRNGEPAPALTLWQAPLPPPDKKGAVKPYSAGTSRNLATRACVAAIHGVLSDARDGNAMLKDKQGMRAVQPGDIAVLVRTHAEATMIRQALAVAGIPAVAAGRLSLFATTEARELHTLLLALMHVGDDGRLRAALSTVLVGADAATIESLDHDAVASHARQRAAQAWRERWDRAGTLALIGDLCAVHAERLLGLLDGERRLSNYLQLAELLQEAQHHALGLQGLVDWLERQIAGADKDDETQLLRLESDARRVQIVTLHKSKGLEYPLVFLPFAGIGGKDKSPGRYCVVHEKGHGRRLHWKFETLPDAEWGDAAKAWKIEQRAEDARLLYVGLTRAEQALWIATGMFYNHDRSALANMVRDPVALAGHAGIILDERTPAANLPRLSLDADAAIPPARIATRRLRNDWWVYSFSQLAKADGGDASSTSTVPASGGNDEPDAAEDAAADVAIDPRFGGNRYGVALHAALERLALEPDGFAAWRDWRDGDEAPGDAISFIAEALRDEGYGADVLEDGVALTTRLVGHTLTARLPEAVRLCDVPMAQYRPEIEFQFALQPTQVDDLLALLHAHGVVRDRHGFGLRQRLEGLMTGLIDLTYCVDGKWYVLDYKSNRLPAYDASALQRAMAHSEYDLQALIYTLALHRWLRFRLGDAYDYARDFGGIRYLFCRGLDAARAESPGIFAQRFTPELIAALDTLFGHVATGVAA